ncbi:hypothetical protein ACS8Y6_01905 [Salinisphaera sp. RV14]|uniref:hypothetical protein n=1 Tax=Salinisphaera sp. RV14 TaxID=3454140 RepID=UPI003F84A434
MRAPSPARIAVLFPIWAAALAIAGYLWPTLFKPGAFLIAPFRLSGAGVAALCKCFDGWREYDRSLNAAG